MNSYPVIAVLCMTAIVVATVLFAAELGIPSEAAVPIIVVLLLGLRVMVRRSRAANHQP